MLSINLRKTFSPILYRINNRFVTNVSINPQEYSEVPEYPPIQDLTYKARKLRQHQSWHNKIKELSTIEEKLFEINMPKYYGYKTIILNETKFPYNCLPFVQYATKTLFQETESLPDFYKKNTEKVDSFLKLIKGEVEDAILFEYEGYKRSKHVQTKNLNPLDKDRKFSSEVANQINRVLLNALTADNPHLSEVEVDLDPRHEAFWFVGGISPPELLKKIRQGLKWQKSFANEPVDRTMQYMGTPLIALRHKLPLEAVTDAKTADADNAVPSFKFDPRTLGYATDHRHGTTIPGFWPGSPQEFGLISYQNRSNLVINAPSYGAADVQEALHAKGILSSYAWLFGQACYQGFSTFNDITYPLTAQTIITNGQNWSFYVYQINTTLLHLNHIDDMNNVNFCWGTKDIKLFEKIENGKLIGFNDDALEKLIHFYINKPKCRDINMKPYLGENVQKIADIEDVERREFLESRYKHMASNRPRHRLTDEVYNWEKIYKVDHNTRPMEPKRRPFELGINPYKRRMDEHTPSYIPKAIRPTGPESKNKWRKTYYP